MLCSVSSLRVWPLLLVWGEAPRGRHTACSFWRSLHCCAWLCCGIRDARGLLYRCLPCFWILSLFSWVLYPLTLDMFFPAFKKKKKKKSWARQEEIWWFSEILSELWGVIDRTQGSVPATVYRFSGWNKAPRAAGCPCSVSNLGEGAYRSLFTLTESCDSCWKQTYHSELLWILTSPGQTSGSYQ